MARIAGRTLIREALKTIRRPRRLLQLVNTEALMTHLRRESIRDVVREQWAPARLSIDNSDATDSQGAEEPALRRREYSSYEDYLAHQRDKLTRISAGKMAQYDADYRAALRERLEKDGLLTRGMSVLCLAARRGTEVKAFTDLGCFAVGIDLNPGEENPHVLPGDFHALQFADGTVDAVFTNSLDHAFDLDKLLSEVRRVLKSDGLFIVEAARGSEEGLMPGFYESLWWSKVEDLVELLEGLGFYLIERVGFVYPWRGEHLCFRYSRGDEKAGVRQMAEPMEVGV